MSVEAMKQALEALEHAAECVQTNYLPDHCGHDWDEQIESLRQAIAEAEKQPKRKWVGLTDEEREYFWNVVGKSDAHGDVDGWSGRDVMEAIEAKLKEKNT